MRYTIEEDVKCLNDSGAIVIGRFIGTLGYVLLWKDRKGYTVTTRERTGSSVGRALPKGEAMRDFLATVERLAG